MGCPRSDAVRDQAGVTAARTTDGRAYLIVLLGAEAGLRSGEMVALEWTDIDLVKGQMCVERSAWKGQVGTTKGGRHRYVPLTIRLATALRDHRHLRGVRVLYQDDGQPLTEKVVQRLVLTAARRAGLRNNGPHILRHHADCRIMPMTRWPSSRGPSFGRTDDEGSLVNAA